MLLFVLCASSCSVKKNSLARDTAESTRLTDSVSHVLQIMQKRVVVPRKVAILTLTPDSLARLPMGAGYTAHEGHAKASVTREEAGYRFIADCDSLTVIVEEMRRDVFRLSRENHELLEQKNEVETIEVNRLTSWQAFQIWAGRIALVTAVLWIVYSVVKR